MTRIVLCFLCGGLAIGWMNAAQASIDFQLFDSGSLTDMEVTVVQGDPLSLDLVATSISAETGVEAELDSFAYRIEFDTEEFWLTGNVFGPPFDSVVLADGGFNGSIPWAPPSVQIDDGADAGSPAATPGLADIYRTTASEAGVPGEGPNLLVETLDLTAPLTLGDYLISLNMLEAADRFGAFHTVDDGMDFLVHVIIPEPATLPLLGLASLAAVRRRRR